MRTPSTSTPAFDGVAVGDPLGPMTLAISRAANERYWASAGVDAPGAASRGAVPTDRGEPHRPADPDGGETGADPDGPQRVVSHRRANADVELTVTGTVTDRYRRPRPRVRSRDRRDHTPRRRTAVDIGHDVLRGRRMKRTLELTRTCCAGTRGRGNFHSDPDAASHAGLRATSSRRGCRSRGRPTGCCSTAWGGAPHAGRSS